MTPMMLSCFVIRSLATADEEKVGEGLKTRCDGGHRPGRIA